MRSDWLVSIGLSAVLFLFSAAAEGHDLTGLGDPSLKQSRKINHAQLQYWAQRQENERTRYVLARLLLWEPGHVLLSCFMNGGPDEKQFVVNAAVDLLKDKDANISFDFGPAPDYRPCASRSKPADVRISFADPCCAAFVGTKSLVEGVRDGPSVKLKGILKYEEKERRRIVWHELLHVLGFEHERKSPDILCEPELKKDVVLALTGWLDAEYDANIKQLDRNEHSYKWSKYDLDSIMNYHLDPKAFKRDGSPCYSGENYVPSETDIRGLKDAYPLNPEVPNAQFRAAINALSGSALPQSVLDLMRAVKSSHQ